MTAFEFKPDYAIPPGTTLREILEERGMSQSDLAMRAGITDKTVSQLVSGIAPLTYETAAKLEMVTGVPSSFWSARETRYRSTLLMREEQSRLASAEAWLTTVPVRELVERGEFETTPNRGILVHRVLSFFGVSSVDAWNEVWLKPQVQFRGSKAQDSRPGYVAAWIRQGEIAASKIDCDPFDAKAFRAAVLEIRSLTMVLAQAAFDRAVELCRKAGVALVLVKEIPKASVSGAAKWVSKDKAVIMLSLKYKTDDQFWFSFFHEAGHILLHGKKQVFVDDGVNGESDEEQAANQFARDLLIPAAHFRRLPHLKTKIDIRRFAAEMGVSPGIVVGRLQWEKFLPQSHCNDLKQKYQWG